MDNLKLTIAYANMIGALLTEFDGTAAAITDIQMQVRKFMFKRKRTNPKLFEEGMALSQRAWFKTIIKFKNEDTKIDAYHAIIGLWTQQDVLLERFVNLSEKRMERLSLLNDSSLYAPERDAYKVADYIASLIKEEIEAV